MRFRGTKRKNFKINDSECLQTQDIYKKLRTERRGYKNIRVSYTQLAESPSAISNVRFLKRQGAQKWKDDKLLKKARIQAERPPAEPSTAKRSLDILHTTSNATNQKNPSSHTADTVISEPYWISGSNSGSVLTTRTAPSQLGVETCQYTNRGTCELSFV